MEEVKEDTHQRGEAEPFIKERGQLEDDQLLKVLHEVSMPSLEDKVARVDTQKVADMEEHMIN
eukprot:12915045-Prorocentrum_lima.AAC.1